MNHLPFALTLGLASSLLTAHASAQFSTPSRKTPLGAPALTPTTPQGLVLLGSDDCSTAASANSISGLGSFAYDTTGSTTGALQPSCINVNHDVWFYWTAPGSGTATFQTCGLATADTTLAVWSDGSPAGTCPAGSALACNDDFCGLQSTVSANVASGQGYFVQLGAYGTSVTYSGQFSIGLVSPDSCATPTPISGLGTFPFDNTTATTGAEGQAEALCDFFGTTGITNDVWYAWTAPSSGTATVALCNGTSMDSKVAVYDGSGCPSALAIACNDDSCSLQSSLQFACVAGQVYTIQLGNYPGGTGSTGTFTIDVPMGPTIGCQYDDGMSENSVGLTAGGDLVLLQRFGGPGSATVSSISIAYGTPPFPDPALNGLAVTVALWDDPNDDGLPNDLVLVATVPSVIANEGTDTFVLANLTSPVSLSGTYFAGVSITHVAGRFPASLDQSQPSSGRAWLAGTTVPGTIDLSNIGAAPIPPSDIDGFGLPGVWLVRADCTSTTGTTVCEGSVSNCPCGNGGAAGHGCANAPNAAGAQLQASGTSSLASDTLLLSASGMPTGTAASSCSFAQASTLGAGVTFGDGVLCLTGSLIRLGTRSIVNGSAALGSGIPGDPAISVAGLVGAPGTRHYQVVYRNAVPFCTPATFNVTNGVSIAWN